MISPESIAEDGESPKPGNSRLEEMHSLIFHDIVPRGLNNFVYLFAIPSYFEKFKRFLSDKGRSVVEGIEKEELVTFVMEEKGICKASESLRAIKDGLV